MLIHLCFYFLSQRKRENEFTLRDSAKPQLLRFSALREVEYVIIFLFIPHKNYFFTAAKKRK
jgi:hypothetical protein